MGMMKEFKEFAMRGNVVDLAVGVIIGGAFGKIVTSMVNDILMPPIGKAMGGVNFADVQVSLDRADGFNGFRTRRSEVNYWGQIYEAGAFIDFNVLDRCKIHCGYTALWIIL